MVEEVKRAPGTSSQSDIPVVNPDEVLNTSIETIIGNQFVQKCGQTEREREETSLTEAATMENLAGLKYVGLFFSAEWCPPCKHMLQPLKNFYTDVNMEERTMEILLVSSDRSQQEWQRHYSTMPWMALTFDSPQNNALRERFRI